MTTPDSFPALPAPIAAALARRGFETLTPVQQAVVSALSAGRDLRISSQTGSGKTVAIGLALAPHFLGEAPLSSEESSEAASASASASAEASGVPADATPGDPGAASSRRSTPRSAAPPSGPRAQRGAPARPSVLVIVPTRELAAQVREELGWLYADVPAVSVEVVTGGTSILMEERALRRGPSLVVGTPGRLLDHLKRGSLECDEVAHVVLDEADQMLDMGFREELEAILEQLPKARASHLVSATFPRAVKALADDFQQDPLVIEGTRLGVAHSDILHIAHAIRRDETYAALVNVLLLAGDARCLLFVARRVDATSLAERLVGDGFVAAPLSGELPQAQRTRTLAAFRSGACPILVSTDVAARGIDVPDIEAVIHVDPPRNGEAYVHRSGRTGRAGSKGRSILLVVAPELRRVERMLRSARIEVSWQPVPTPAKVRKAMAKRARRALHARLDGATPSEERLLEAKELLEARDPVALVAALLDAVGGEAAREPLPVIGIDPFVDDRPKRRRPAPASGGRGDGSRTRPDGPAKAGGRKPVGGRGEPAKRGASKGPRVHEAGDPPAERPAARGRAEAGRPGKPRPPLGPRSTRTTRPERPRAEHARHPSRTGERKPTKRGAPRPGERKPPKRGASR